MTVLVLLLAPFGVLSRFSPVGDNWLAMGWIAVFAGALQVLASVSRRAVMPPYLPYSNSKVRFPR